MKQIVSKHNETYKQLRNLSGNAKFRRQQSQTILEGAHLCQSYLQQVGPPLICAYTDSAKENRESAQLIDSCDYHAVPIILLGESNFKAVSSLSSSQGIIFIISTPKLSMPISLGSNAVLLENVQDPGNMGTLLRTAAAAGISEVYASAGCASVWSPKVLRAGMGAHFALNVYEEADLISAVSKAKVSVMATTLSAKKTIYELDLSQPAAWLFGNEGSGVSDELLSLGVEQVIIPQNPQVESLNVAAAAAVCLFEQARQLNNL